MIYSDVFLFPFYHLFWPQHLTFQFFHVQLLHDEFFFLLFAVTPLSMDFPFSFSMWQKRKNKKRKNVRPNIFNFEIPFYPEMDASCAYKRLCCSSSLPIDTSNWRCLDHWIEKKTKKSNDMAIELKVKRMGTICLLCFYRIDLWTPIQAVDDLFHFFFSFWR